MVISVIIPIFVPKIYNYFNTPMKKYLISLLLLLGCIGSQAQTNLAGRVYYNANIMSDKMKELNQEVDQMMEKAKADAIKKQEQKKKRKLNASEKAKIEQKIRNSQTKLLSMEEGLKAAVTVTFKNENTVVIKTNMKYDDNVMKDAGVSWAKRKMFEASCAASPSEKAKYVVKGDMIILDDGKEKDTMYLSDKGKTITGRINRDTPFKLTRTK
jgi:hypothetical protein